MLNTKLLILVISLAHITYADKSTSCSKGPSYWCESLQNARDCHAFTHCLDSVWSKHSTYTQSREDDSFLTKTNTPNQCANCVQCVLNTQRSKCPVVHEFESEVEQMRTSGVTPSAICRLLKQCAPLESSQQDIDLSQLLDQSNAIGAEESKINRHFKCGLHPRNWCESVEQAKKCDAFGQCMKYSWTNMAYKLKEEPTADTFDHDQKSCSFCVYVFDNLQRFLQRNVEVNVRQYLESACALLPSKDKSSECVKSVSEHFNEIDQLIAKKLSSTVVCKLLKICDDKFIDSDGQSTKPSQADLDLVESIPKILKEAKVRIVDSAETKLTKTDLVSDEEPKIRLVSDASKAMSDKMSEETMGVGCELCQIVFNAAKYLLDNKVDHQRIFKFVEKELCYRLGNMNQTCVDYIEQEGELLLHLLEKQVDPSAICHQMGMCLNVQVNWRPTSSVATTTTSDIKFYDLNVRNDMNCTLCKMVLLQVKLMLSDKRSEQKILDYINQNLCARTGKSQETCRTLIDAYGPVLLHLISQDIHPDQMCDMIGMCKKKSCHDDEDQEGSSSSEEQVITIEMIDLTPAKSVENKQDESNNVECVLCEFAMSLLAKELKENATEPELEALMNKVCSKIMPSQLRPQCANFVQQYGPIIIQLLINRVEPTKICQAISVCPGSSLENSKFVDSEHMYRHRQREWARKGDELNEKIDRMQEKKKNVGNNTLECSLCVYIGEIVEKALSQNKTEDQITQEMKLICNLFPAQLRDQCSAFVSEYASYILKLIVTEVDPHQACAALKLCDQTPKESRRNLLRRSRFY